MHKVFYFLNVIFTIKFVFLKKFFSSSKRHLLVNKIMENFYYLRDSELEQIECDEIVCDKIFIDKTPVKKGNVTEQESLTIGKLIWKFQPERVFEIGTFNGKTTFNIAMNLPENGKVFTLDLPKTMIKETRFKTDLNERIYINKETSGMTFKGKEEIKDKIVQLFGDSATFDYSDYFSQMDFIFIDGAHTYDYVLNDTKIALKLLKPTGGVIVWHDYNSITYTGNTKAINLLRKTNECLKEIKLIRGTSIAFINIRKNN